MMKFIRRYAKGFVSLLLVLSVLTSLLVPFPVFAADTPAIDEEIYAILYYIAPSIRASNDNSISPTKNIELVFQNPIKVYQNQKISELPTPARDGYDFDGWFIGDTQYTADSTFTEDKTLIAKWTQESSSQVEFHRKALTEPCVKLSLHTAPRIPVKVSNREPSAQTYWALFLQVHQAILLLAFYVL